MKEFIQVIGVASEALTTGTVDLRGASQQVAEYIAKRLDCSRVNIWVFEGPPGARLMRRLVTYCSSPEDQLGAVVALTEAQFGVYVAVLTRQGCYACDDVLVDERLKPMYDSYLQREDIRAALVAPISVNAKTLGILACMQRGAPRHWLPREVTLVKRMANEISLRRARRGAAEAQTSMILNELLRPTEPSARG